VARQYVHAITQVNAAEQEQDILENQPCERTHMARRRTGWEGGNLAVEIEKDEENEEREARSRVIEKKPPVAAISEENTTRKQSRMTL